MAHGNIYLHRREAARGSGAKGGGEVCNRSARECVKNSAWIAEGDKERAEQILKLLEGLEIQTARSLLEQCKMILSTCKVQWD